MQLGLGRQVNREPGPAGFTDADFQFTTVLFDKPSGRRQTQSCAKALGGEQWFENARQRLSGDTGTIVIDGQCCTSVAR